MGGHGGQNKIENRLRLAHEECERLRAENARLRAMLGIQDSTSVESSQTTIPAEAVSESRSAGPPAPEKKIALFRSLFRGREDCILARDKTRHDKSCVNGFVVLESRERPDGFACLLLREAELVEALQVKPELGGRAEEMGKAQGRIAGDGALAVENPGDAVGRHLKPETPVSPGILES